MCCLHPEVFSHGHSFGVNLSWRKSHLTSSILKLNISILFWEQCFITIFNMWLSAVFTLTVSLAHMKTHSKVCVLCNTEDTGLAWTFCYCIVYLGVCVCIMWKSQTKFHPTPLYKLKQIFENIGQKCPQNDQYDYHQRKVKNKVCTWMMWLFSLTVLIHYNFSNPQYFLILGLLTSWSYCML